MCRQCLSFLLRPNSGPSCSSWLEAPAPEVKLVSQALTHAFLLCWGWKRAHVPGSTGWEVGTGRDTRFHCFSEMLLLFSFSVLGGEWGLTGS